MHQHQRTPNTSLWKSKSFHLPTISVSWFPLDGNLWMTTLCMSLCCYTLLCLGKHMAKAAGSNGNIQAHQLNAAVLLMPVDLHEVFYSTTWRMCCLMYITKIMQCIKLFLLSSIAIKSFGWGSFLLCHVVYRK